MRCTAFEVIPMNGIVIIDKPQDWTSQDVTARLRRVFIIPFVIYAMRKPSWKDPNAEFAPFHWEEKK